MNKCDQFQLLYSLFKKNGFSLFLVGGTVRDFLLGRNLTDMDAATDATPNEMKRFIPDANYRFEKMGSISLIFHDVKFDITTFREEKHYKDSRHPDEIVFVKDMEKDYKRRDFTINSMYLDNHYRLFDFTDGQIDLNKKVIKMIGNPKRRIKEDPLRILRAIRFSLDLDFDIETSLEKVMEEYKNLLKLVKKDKLLMEIKKIKTSNEKRKNELFVKFGIYQLISVIE